ncbi:uncharacterized protein [Onthophagus taurus]|uniref:uncharacterized protein isoform X2 n=1 Tax=Onthophagus taurus TaxID=166361 RepID=UPI0039BDCBC0
MGKICRLCLKLTNSNEITNITKEHLLQLHFVVPEIDLKTKLVKSPLICMECTRSLQVAHNFKSMCLETEKRLESYLDGNGMVNFKELLDMDCDNKKDQEQDFLFSHLVHDKVEENNENQEELNSIIDDIPYSPPKLLLPTKSQNLYQRQYQHFITWCESQKIETYSENVFLMYFNEKARSQKASTLWSIYSMLKSTFIAKHNINMSVYTRLITFIKQQNLGYIPKQSNVFNRKQVCKFLEEAPDHKYLLWKELVVPAS